MIRRQTSKDFQSWYLCLRLNYTVESVSTRILQSPSPLSSSRSSTAEWPALSKSNRANVSGDDKVDNGSLLVGKHLRRIWLLRLFTPSSSRPEMEQKRIPCEM